jgi:hypothetical protein
METPASAVSSTKVQDHLRRLPPLLRAVSTLLLTVLGAGLLAALLTPDDVADGEFMLGIAIVHLAFGFVYGDWWAAAGPLLWLPLGLFMSDEGVAARLATAVLVVAALAVLVAAGVGIGKLLRRSARWRSFEERSRQGPGALALWPGIALGLGLAASMWVADALTASPLVVFLVAAAGWFGVRALGPRVHDAPARELHERIPSAWTDQPWKRWPMILALLCGFLAIFLLLTELAVSLGMSEDDSANGPPVGSSTVWALALLVYAGHMTPRVMRR